MVFNVSGREAVAYVMTHFRVCILHTNAMKMNFSFSDLSDLQPKLIESVRPAIAGSRVITQLLPLPRRIESRPG